MKHPLFEPMGASYPHHLEAQYERILTRIEQLWESPDIDAYFSDLLIDRRGGRQGFPTDVLNDILQVRAFLDAERLTLAERAADAADKLHGRGLALSRNDFLQALNKGEIELIDLYVRANFNIHQPDDKGATPLLTALRLGYTVIALIFIRAGADVDAADKLGLTPLLMACGKASRGFHTVTEELIKRGAQINVRDPLGNTPFLLAVSGGQLDIVQLLIERGANITAVNRRGEDALTLARNLGDPDYLIKVETLLQSAAFLSRGWRSLQA